MYGALWDFAATHDNNAEWKQKSAAWVREVARLYHLHNAFDEYNSPTYYGVDLFGLALWRSYGSTADMRDAGASIEATSGTTSPTSTIPACATSPAPTTAPTAWTWRPTSPSPASGSAPYCRPTRLPSLSPMRRPIICPTSGSPRRLSSSALTRLPRRSRSSRTFTGEHAVKRQITDDRRATAWIGDKVILGGENTKLTKDAPPDTQFHPATAQWRTPSETIGWFYVWQSPKINADVDHTTMTHHRRTARSSSASRPPAPRREDITADKWTLPGLTVSHRRRSEVLRRQGLHLLSAKEIPSRSPIPDMQQTQSDRYAAIMRYDSLVISFNMFIPQGNACSWESLHVIFPAWKHDAHRQPFKIHADPPVAAAIGTRTSTTLRRQIRPTVAEANINAPQPWR